MINPILERLNKVRPSGNNSWRACCPAHGGNNPSALTIREEPDGRILMHCFQGCSAVDVMGAIGLDVAELFPEPIAHHSKPVSRKFYATDILAAIRVECQIVMLAAFELEQGRKLPEVDLKRLRLAMETYQRIRGDAVMSNLDRGVAALDEARAKRRGLMLSEKIDFEGFMKAREEDKANVKQATDYLQDLIDVFYGEEVVTGLTLPWSKTNDNFRMRDGEVTLWPGVNGHGKSQVLGQVMNHVMHQGQKVLIMSFEMLPYKTLARMTRQAVGSNKPSEQFIRDYMEWLTGKLWLYDQQGTVKGDRVIAVIYYAAETFGIKHFVVDSLMKCGIRSDDWNAQKEFLDKITAAARDLNVHIHLVAHSRKGDDEYAPPNKMDVAGSADITNQVDNVMTVWRNKAKEKAIRQNKAKPEDMNKPDCLVICDKQRHGEWEGEIALWFDPASMRYKASQHEKVWEMKL